jgi:hypothetical protein
LQSSADNHSTTGQRQSEVRVSNDTYWKYDGAILTQTWSLLIIKKAESDPIPYCVLKQLS